MKLRILIFFSLLLSYSRAFSQNISFEKVIGSPGLEIAVSVKQMTNGDIFVAGYTDSGTQGGYDQVILKLDRYGNLIWTKYYGTSSNDYFTYLGKCTDGSLVVAGTKESPVTGTDVVVCKLDTAGNVQWSKTFSTAVNESVKYIEETSDKGFILCGFQNDSYGYNDSYVLKIDSAGNKEWDKAYGGSDNDYADMVKETPEGHYIVTADTRSQGAGGYDVEVLKLNSRGDVIWDFTYGDQLQNGCQGILITSEGKYLSYGETEIYQFSPFNFFMELIDTNGTSLWRHAPGGLGSDAAFSAVEAGEGNFVFTGYSNSNTNGTKPNDLVVFKADTGGNIKWISHFGGESIDIGYDMIKSGNGFVIAGKRGDTNDQFYVLGITDTSAVTGIKELSAGLRNVSVFPNPSGSGMFTIKTGMPMNSPTLSIYSMLGEVVEQKVFSGMNDTFTISPELPGLYIFRITDSSQSFSGRLLNVKSRGSQ